MSSHEPNTEAKRQEQPIQETTVTNEHLAAMNEAFNSWLNVHTIENRSVREIFYHGFYAGIEWERARTI